MRTSVRLAVVCLAACADPVIPPPVPAELVVLKAPPAITTPGGEVDTIAVQLRDAQGRPVPGHRVTWSGDGTFRALDTVTDDLGLAHAQWTLPRYRAATSLTFAVGPSGRYRAVATVDGVAPLVLETEARAFRVDVLSASSSYACGVRNAELWCWGGYPWPLAFGIGNPVPRKVRALETVSVGDVAAGQRMVCALSLSGRPFCTTNAFNGGFTTVASIPGLVDMVEAGTFFCGRTVQREVRCWDVDGPRALLAFEKLGTATTTLAGGDQFACATTDNGEAWCWGRNDRGQLGNGLRVDSDEPVRVLAPVPFTRVAAGGRGACGITAANEIWCWGRAVLPDESPVPRKVVVPGVQGPRFALGSWGEGYTWNGGTLYTWFNSGFVPLAGLTEQFHRVVDLSVTSQACVRTDTGEVLCSWILLHGGGDTSPFPSELVPVPDPASQP